MRIPFFASLWIALCATTSVAIFAGILYLAYSAIQIGPEGLGRMAGNTAGSVVSGFKDASK